VIFTPPPPELTKVSDSPHPSNAYPLSTSSSNNCSTVDTLVSQNATVEASSKEVIHINHPIIVASPALSIPIDSSSNSSPTHPNAQACTDSFEVAGVGSLAVENDESVSMDTQIAPEYSQETLDYYNDIQEYLQQANSDETETKKKKKKKKKANPTSTPDNPILFYV
jgi:hypothetical protein